MYIKLCDRCGRVTKNKVAFLLPSSSSNGSLQVGGTWFGDNAVCLCNNCLDDFKKFRIEHEQYNVSTEFVHEKNENR